jgi:hypothetical protein
MATKVFIEADGNRIVVPADAELSDFPGCTYEAGSEDTEGEAAYFRKLRNDCLTMFVDPLVTNQLRWSELTAAKRSEWTTYRQDLLDLPQQAGFPNNITWPIAPE